MKIRRISREGFLIVVVLFSAVVSGCAAGRQTGIYEKPRKIPRAIGREEEVEFTVTWLKRKQGIDDKELALLRDKRGVKIIGEANLRTLVGKTKELQAMMEIPYIEKITLNGTLGATSVEMKKVRIGTLMTISSKALADGSVKAEIAFELRKLVKRISVSPSIPESLGVPIVDIAKGQTAVVIRDGESLSLGGVTAASTKQGETTLLFITMKSLREDGATLSR